MKPIFSRNIDIDKIAFLNWRISEDLDILNIINIADGFMLSSIELANICLENNDDKKADVLIFPILTNVNHGIELYLKGMIWILNKIMRSTYKIEGRHNIQQILQVLKSKIRQYNGRISVEEFNEATFELQDYIDELFQKIKASPQDDRMDFSRYPFNKKYENHFYIQESDNVEIDLENFVQRFTVIHESLKNLSDFLIYKELPHETN